jgi:DNA-binding CsgD family transcriptional regulator
MRTGARPPSLQDGAEGDGIPRAPDLCDAGDLLVSQMLETVTSVVHAPVALGLKIDERQTVARVIVFSAHACDAEAAAPLIRRLPDLEPIDPFTPRRAAAAGASVMWAGDAGGPEQVAASMYGRHLRRHGYGTPATMYFRSEGRIVFGLALLRTVESPPFESHEIELLLQLRPFLETALTFPGAREQESAQAPPTAGLTSREAEVAGLVAGGLSNAGIAVALGMSEATVKAHLTRVYAKLGLRTRTQLAVLLPRYTEPVRAAVEVGAA